MAMRCILFYLAMNQIYFSCFYGFYTIKEELPSPQPTLSMFCVLSQNNQHFLEKIMYPKTNCLWNPKICIHILLSTFRVIDQDMQNIFFFLDQQLKTHMAYFNVTFDFSDNFHYFFKTVLIISSAQDIQF